MPISRRPSSPKTPGLARRRAERPADALTAAIRKSLDALDAAGEEAAKGRLGAAKLGLMVAATAIIEAFKAADDEFARRFDSTVTPRDEPEHQVNTRE